MGSRWEAGMGRERRALKRVVAVVQWEREEERREGGGCGARWASWRRVRERTMCMRKGCCGGGQWGAGLGIDGTYVR